MSKRSYHSNNVYILEIHGCQYYIGCHSRKDSMYESAILNNSGNPLRNAQRKGLLTYQEYKDCCRVVHIEEFETKEAAEAREAELIKELKKRYGEFCLNKSPGNKYGQAGLKRSEVSIERIRKNHIRKAVFQYSLDGQFIAEYPSIREAVRQTGIRHISEAASGKIKAAGNFLWK